jgi:hypothetical protein
MELQVKICGVFMILLALMHVVLPRYFQWKQQLQSLTIITRQIMYVHTFFIAFVVLLMGLLCITSATDLLSTNLGRTICTGLFSFWFTRLVFQFLVYSRKVWRGKKFETTIHILFSMLWTYFSAVFLLCVLR